MYISCVFKFTFLLSGIMDIVDIDWTSLVQSSQPKPASTGSALQRFRAPAIFAKLGVSRELAGNELFEKIQSSCQQELDKQREENTEGKIETLRLQRTPTETS